MYCRSTNEVLPSLYRCGPLQNLASACTFINCVIPRCLLHPLALTPLDGGCALFLSSNLSSSLCVRIGIFFCRCMARVLWLAVLDTCCVSYLLCSPLLVVVVSCVGYLYCSLWLVSVISCVGRRLRYILLVDRSVEYYLCSLLVTIRGGYSSA